MTLKEIAAELGVSPSIISRVLSGYTHKFSITDELRQRILKKVEECGYRPNPVFSAIKQKKNKQISILYYSPSPKSTGLTMDDMIDEASLFFQENHYFVNFSFSSGGDRKHFLYQLPLWKVSGLLIPDNHEKEALSAVENAGIPYVCMNGIAAEKGVSVLCDEEDGIKQILEQFQHAGHRKICLIQQKMLKSEGNFYSIGEERRKAFLLFCANMGMEASLLEHQPSGGSADRFREQVYLQDSTQLSELIGKGITAFICESSLCPELYYRIHQLGKRIPEDLSIIAYNNDAVLRWLFPPVTVFEIPARAMGKLAAELLLRKISGQPEYDNGKTHFLKGKLICRESVAAAQ